MYSINGQEKDKELNENITTALYWEYDSRIGRRWNLDPATKIQPGLSPYVVFDNGPVLKNDPKGDLAPLVIWLLKKLGDAAIGVMTDVAIQLVAEKYFGNNGQGHSSWGDAWEKLDIDWAQAAGSGATNLVKNKHLAAAINAGSQILSYYFRDDNPTWDGAMAKGVVAALTSYIAGGISTYIAKYGSRGGLMD
jgi:hypothetical protein